MKTARLLATPEQIADEERAERLRALHARERAEQEAPVQVLPAAAAIVAPQTPFDSRGPALSVIGIVSVVFALHWAQTFFIPLARAGGGSMRVKNAKRGRSYMG